MGDDEQVLVVKLDLKSKDKKMIVNPVLVGIVGTLFIEMTIVIIKDYIIKRRKDTNATKNKTF